MTIRVAVADDHPIVLKGVSQLFLEEDGFEVVARCRTGEEALRAVREQVPDVLVLDIRLPDRSGLEILREIEQSKLPTRVVLLTAVVSDEEAIEAMRAGARGIVLKEMSPTLLVQCVRKVFAGGQWFEKESLSRALDKIFERHDASKRLEEVLTGRELEIMRLVAQGLSNQQIAEKLFITPGTVKVHVHTIYRKLGVNGRVQLTLLAREHGVA